jgi:hypothetical protein
MPTNGSTARGHLRIIVEMSVVLLAAGCSSRGTVSGKVLYKGKPLPGGSVIFIHQQGAFSSGIREDGSYSIDRIPTGPVKIAVIGLIKAVGPLPKGVKAEKLKQNTPKLQEKVPQEIMAAMTRPPEAGKKSAVFFPPKYSNPEQSGLEYTVVGGPQTYDIQLE